MGKKTRRDYAQNWEEISHQIKVRDSFSCRRCGLKFDEGKKMRVDGKWRRLTVHHKDRDVTNNSDENLIALCCKCHCVEEWPLIRRELAEKKTRNQVKNGQLLFGF